MSLSYIRSATASTELLLYAGSQVEDKAKYGQEFESLKPINGRLHGDKVFQVSLLVLLLQAGCGIFIMPSFEHF